MDFKQISKRYQSLQERAQKTKSKRTRPRVRKERRPKVERLDPRMLLAADIGLADASDAPPQRHALFAQELGAQYHHHHEHDGHDHSHGSHCGCSLCAAATSSDSLLVSDYVKTVPDFDFSGTSSGASNNSAPNGKWSQPGGLGSAVTITYSYAGLLDQDFADDLSRRDLRASVEESLGLWASYAPLNFVEVEDSGPPIFINGQDNTTYRSGSTPDIRIGHHNIDGPNETLAYAYFPETNYWGASGDIHMDTSETWNLGNGPGTDFLEVMTHELGHALGLDHEDNATAIMNPFHAGVFSGLGTGFLYSHDIDTIRGLYGTGTGSVTPIIYNDPPEVASIADQNVAFGSSNFTVSVQATDSDGDQLTYTATALQVDPTELQAFQLKQEYGFRPASGEYYNARGYGEKYFLGQGSQWFYVLPSGSIFQWGGSIANSQQIAQVDSSIHSQLSKLTAATEPSMTPIDAELTWLGTELTVNTNGNTPESFIVSIDVADRYEVTNETFAVQIVDQAPVIDPIADQTVSARDGAVTLTVNAFDPEGGQLSFDASASTIDAMSVAAAELQTQYSFRAGSTEAYNYRGQGEKYFLGQGSRWFFIVPSGSVHRWGGSIAASPQVGQLDSTFHDDLTLLYQATATSSSSVDVAIAWSGNQLTLDWPNNFLGSFVVTATVSDSRHEASTTFNVDIANGTPTLTPIANQHVSVSQGNLTIPVIASDSDGDALQLSATATQIDAAQVAAYQLKTDHGLRSIGRDYYNARGYGEKYFYGEGSRWFFIMPNGNIHRWTGSIGGSTLIGEVNPSYHQNLASLLNAQAPTSTTIDAVLTWSESDLQIAIPDGFVGDFDVTVTASDGAETVATTFTVTVANQAPTLAPIGSQSFDGQTSITLPVIATDLDGDTLSFSATASTVDPLQTLAYELKQQHGFVSARSDYYNSRGHQAKYFQGAGGAWHFILPTGDVYRWSGSVNNSTLLGQLDPSFHANLALLVNATAPTTQSTEIELTWSGNRLTIHKPNSDVDNFDVTVSVTDGAETASTTFTVTNGPATSQSASSTQSVGFGTSAAKTLKSMAHAVDQIMSELANT